MILDDPIKTDVRVCFSSRSRILHPVAAAASTTARPLQAYVLVVLEKSPSVLRAGNLPLLAAWPLVTLVDSFLLRVTAKITQHLKTP